MILSMTQDSYFGIQEFNILKKKRKNSSDSLLKKNKRHYTIYLSSPCYQITIFLPLLCHLLFLFLFHFLSHLHLQVLVAFLPVLLHLQTHLFF